MSSKVFQALGALLVVGIATGGLAASGETVGWTDWASSNAGNIAPDISVTYQGETIGLATNYPSWTPTGSFVGGTVGNAPPRSFNAIDLVGGTTQTNTISFSTPVVDPVMAIWSLGSPSIHASFDFTASEPFTLQASGPNVEFGGSGVMVSGDIVSGAEGNGTIQFEGTFSQISWTNPSFEDYYAFTIGVAGPAVPTVPEPASLLCIFVGILSFAVLRRAMREHKRC